MLDGTVAAMSTDGSILAGFAAQNEGELKVVGDAFSEERIGVGYSKDTPEMCEWINDVLEESFEDGSWADAFELTLGPSGVETPDPPELDECQPDQTQPDQPSLISTEVRGGPPRAPPRTPPVSKGAPPG